MLIGPESCETPSQRVTKDFYEWERWGRSCRFWDYTVDVIPPLVPFSRSKGRSVAVHDDARVSSRFGALFGGSSSKNTGSTPQPSASLATALALLKPRTLISGGLLSEVTISLPPKLKITPQGAEQFILNLSACSGPISFEIIGSTTEVSVQFACQQNDQPQLEQQLTAHFPETLLSEHSSFLTNRWHNLARGNSVIVEFVLGSEFMRPLALFRTFEPDPLAGVVGALAKLRVDEIGILQILFRAVHNNWVDSVMQAVTTADGRPFFKDAPESVALAKAKVSRPLFGVILRVAARSDSNQRSHQIVKALGAALHQFSEPTSNQLVPLNNHTLPLSQHEDDLLERTTHRTGMLLNSEELSGLVHLPSASVRSDKLKRNAKTTRSAPPVALGNELVLGENIHAGHRSLVTLNPEQRMRHIMIAGSTGSGKTTLLKSMAVQNMLNGDGCCVIDPHADLINDLLAQVPTGRHSDVIVFDPTDECPIPFNVLTAHSDLEKNLLASDLISIFRRQCTSWGDQMNTLISNAVLAFLESNRGGTLADLRRFLVEPEYRRDFLTTVQDEELIYYWTKEFPLLRGHPQAPILTRLNAFLRPKPIRAMVSQQAGSLNLRSVIDERKILFVKLGQGAIGIENAQLLGSLILSKLHQVALSRQNVDEAERTKVNIYVDECQYFLTNSVTALLTGGRKFGVGLVLATQEFFALWNSDKEVASAVLTNPYTRICFRLGDIDAKRLERGFSHFDAQDLQNLGTGEAIARMERNEFDFNLKTFPPPVIDPDLARIRRQQIIELSRQHYGKRPEQTVIPEPRLTAPLTANVKAIQPQPVQARTEPPIHPESPNQHQASTIRSENTPHQLGRGGQQHRYLQNLIKRLAEDKGFHVVIEQPVLSGTGSVDVVLERAGRRIACEISVSSTSDHEMKNIEKCLAAGFDEVILLSPEKRTLSRIRELITAELDIESNRVLCLMPEEFISFLDQAETEPVTTEETVRGYKVKLKYKTANATEHVQQRKAVAQVILKALQRLKQDT